MDVNRGVGTRSCVVAVEAGVAVKLTNKQIKIAVIVDIGKGRTGGLPNIRNPEGFVSTFLDISRNGGAWSCAVPEEESVAASVANEEIKIAVTSSASIQACAGVNGSLVKLNRSADHPSGVISN